MSVIFSDDIPELLRNIACRLEEQDMLVVMAAAMRIEELEILLEDARDYRD